MKKYLRVWSRLAINNFGSYFSNPLDISSYLLGKIIRFGFYFVFLFYLTRRIESLAGYSPQQVLLFYLVFNLVDIVTQAFLRGIYDVARQINQGWFDTFLTQPLNPIFRAASNIVDGLDFITLVPLMPVLVWSIFTNFNRSFLSLAVFMALIVNALLIALAFHILALAMAVLTFESHNVMFFYRNLLNMMRFPLDIYGPILQFVMLTLIPVGVMISFPTKALLGILGLGQILYSFLLAALFFLVSLQVWRWALRRYQGVSS